MTQPNPSTAMARAIVDELTRRGVTQFFISPGSRGAGLVLAAREHSAVDTTVVLDERSAGFQALGWAKATGAPAAVVSTSGTAPANYLPAVVEANMSLTPLVVLSADRPAELHGIGSNQTISQVGLYGDHVRWSASLDAPDASLDLNPVWRATASEAAGGAIGGVGPPGPIHLNLAFREPTVPVTDDGRTKGEPYPFDIEGREGESPWTDAPAGRTEDPDIDLEAATRGLLIAGEGHYDRGRVRAAANQLGWPVLATALSGLRGDDAITNYHHLLAAGLPSALTPDMVVAVGAIGPSPRLEDLCDSAGTVVRIDRWRHIDPHRTASHVVQGSVESVLARLAGGATPDPEWAGSWDAVSEAVGQSVRSVLDDTKAMTGAAAARAMNEVSWETLVVASSLPIREIDAHLLRAGRVEANRGASGIDGFVSTALGIAAASPRTVALAGDLSVLHDSNGFLTEGPRDLVLVVIDNNGGGLFDELPPARHAPDFERLFVAPHGRDLATLAAFHDIGYREATTAGELTEAVEGGLERGGLTMIRVAVDRDHDLRTRIGIDAAGADAVSGLA